MAKQLKPEDVHADVLTDKEFRSAIEEINSSKERAREHNGSAAKLTKDFADKHNLDPKAMTFVAQLSRKDRQQAQTTLREVILNARRMGMFDQIDAFDDLIPVFRQVVADADAGADMTKHGAKQTAKTGPVAVN